MFEADTLYGEFVGQRTFYGYLASQRYELFRDADFAELYCQDNGRPSVPPSLLATALVLQTYDGVSDDEATRRAAFDLQWKVALGVEVERAAVCQKYAAGVSSATDRARPDAGHLSAESGDGQTARGVEEGASAAGAAAHQAGAGYDLHSWAWCRQRYLQPAGGWHRPGAARPGQAGSVRAAGACRRAGVHAVRERPSLKGQAEVDWTDPQARQRFLAEIVADAEQLLELVRGTRAGPGARTATRTQELVAAAELLARILAQDIERDDRGPRLKRGVAPDRLISVHDPEMRHGRKSSSHRFNGHKAQVAVDTDYAVDHRGGGAARQRPGCGAGTGGGRGQRSGDGLPGGGGAGRLRLRRG